MNELKMSIILPLVIVLFVYGSGVYCPGILRPGAGIYRPETTENELPSNYPLNRCVSHSEYLEFDDDSTYELDCNEERPSACELIQRSTDGPNFHPFERADVNFISMMEEEMTFTKVSDPRPWTVTCYFSSVTLAQQFYKLITRDRISESVPIVRADYLKNSDDIVLAEQSNLHSEGDVFNVKIVLKNNVGDAVLLFHKSSVTEIRFVEITRVDIVVRSMDPSERRLYKLGFWTLPEALLFMEFLE